MRSHTIVIAEAGVNHNGSIELAKKLVDVAAEAGADYVKFQTFKADKLVTKNARKAHYQDKNMPSSDNSQHAMLKRLELSNSMHIELISHSENRGIKFISTPFDEESADYLMILGMNLIKISSGDITNLPFLEHIALKKKPTILSTGMSTLKEIHDALSILTFNGLELDLITVLHCNTEYPTPMDDVNLLAMRTIKDTFGVKVGYSDHTLGIEVPIAAVALGAQVIEKHFTLDRNMIGPDHFASIEPDQLKEMVKAIRNIELAISGDGRKTPSPSEINNMAAARKSIHLKNKVVAGETILHEHLVMKRPGDGISPVHIQNILGKKYKSALSADTKLTWDQIAD